MSSTMSTTTFSTTVVSVSNVASSSLSPTVSSVASTTVTPPQTTTSPTTTSSTTSNPSTSAPLNQTVVCITQLFGNWSGNGPLPYHLLPQYNSTLPSTTGMPSTTEASTAIPTTISAEEARRRLCESYSNWTFEFPTCLRPCDQCYKSALNLTNEYYICREWMNGTQPAQILESEPMVLTQLLNKFGAQGNTFTDYDRLCPERGYEQFDNFVWYAGRRYRYSDMRLPDYKKKPFVYYDRLWNERNDTIEVPYGNIPRGEYTFEFAMYEPFFDKKISPEKTRLKEKWAYKHPIVTGAFIDTRVEKGLYTNERLVLNSVIISLELTPPRKNPLPGENIISLTHLDKKLTNPLCVYWQPLDPETEGVISTAGYWSNYGMRVFKTNDSMTVCRSTHLSSFALFMEPPFTPEPEEVNPLGALMVLLTLIAIVLFSIYILAMILLKCYRNHYSRIYMLFAFSCLLSQIFFLVGYGKKDDYDGCNTMATFMQFCHVSVMMWVLMESVHQLSRIRYFFNNATNIDAFYLILGYGFPLAVLVALQEFPYNHFDELKFCWAYLEGTDYLYFAGPLVILTLVTLSLRLITLLEIRKHPDLIDSDINYQRAYRSLIASVVVLPTLVILWGFGTYAVKANDSIGDVAMIALPVLNIFVAIEILYLYFYCNDEVRDSILGELSIRQKQRILKYSHLNGLDMKLTYKAANNGYVDDEQNDDMTQLDDLPKKIDTTGTV